MRGIKASLISGSEAQLHEQVCDYLRLQYPGVMFHTDFAAGAYLKPGQASANKRLQSGRAWPDLFIARPKPEVLVSNLPKGAVATRLIGGLFLELKKKGTAVYRLSDGELVSNPHILEQAEILRKLREAGYAAQFAIGFEEAKRILDDYLG